MSSVLGNLSGDREHVQWNPVDFILLMIKGITTTLSAPNIDWQVEMTPVDFVSEMIVRMSQVKLLTNSDLYLWFFRPLYLLLRTKEVVLFAYFCVTLFASCTI